MKKYLLHIFIYISISLIYAAFSANDATVVIYKDKSTAEKVSEFFSDLHSKVKSKSKDIPLGVDTNLLSLSNFTAGVIFDVKDIPPNELHHDTDKIYSDIYDDSVSTKISYWTRISVGGKIIVPLYFSIPNIMGPIGINVGGEIGSREEYIFTVKTNQIMDDDDTLVETLLNKLGRSIKSIGKIRIPMTAKTILEKYQGGTEITRNGSRFLITKLGVNVGLAAFSANLDYYALIDGKIRTNIKILYNKNKKLIEYSINKGDTTGSEVSESIGLGVTLFETSWLSGSLRVNLISSKLSHVASKNIYFDYIYDVSYPEAERAFNEALKGNLIPTEQIAIFKSDEDKFRGVIINSKRTDVLYETLRSGTVGFVANESALSSYVGALKAKETFGGFMYRSSSVINGEGDSKIDDYLSEKKGIKSFNWTQNDSGRFLFGILSKYDKSASIKSEVLTSDTVIEGVGRHEINVNKLSFTFKYRDYKEGNRVGREFFESALRVLGNNNRALHDAITESSKRSSCSDDITLKINGTFYDQAILNILFYEEKEMWSVLGRALKIDPPSRLRYEKTRKEYLDSLWKEYYKKSRYYHHIMIGPYNDDYVEKLKDEYPELVKGKRGNDIIFTLLKNINEIKKILDRIETFDDKFLPAWKIAKDKNFKNREELANNLKELFSVYGLDTFGFELLTLLAGFDYKSDKDNDRYAEGLYTRFSIKSSKCDFNFSQMGHVRYRIGDITRSWN